MGELSMSDRELIQRLLSLKKAVYELNGECNKNDIKIEELENYPFDCTFDELTWEVVHWVHKTIDRLNKN